MSSDANTPVLRNCIRLPLAEDELLEVTAKAKDYAIMHGAAMRSKTAFSPDSLNFAPFVLVPSSFPRKEFDKAVALQPIINRLMHNVAHDEEFITTTLAETIKVDEFTANLFNIYRKVLAHGFTQRSDAGVRLSRAVAAGAANGGWCGWWSGCGRCCGAKSWSWSWSWSSRNCRWHRQQAGGTAGAEAEGEGAQGGPAGPGHQRAGTEGDRRSFRLLLLEAGRDQYNSIGLWPLGTSK
ncbi:glutathione synthetase-like isoform X6 [Drosophila teissieri]|uniref:glutathione synthetase-like isoform X6 n=1 Tax=Drosophila teissieri TaxID=7243 RepID=UPI001CBA02CE|nr:glutathione synthetase-like isoform X6 [Drosophila teissieri]